MSAPPFRLVYTDEFLSVIEDMRASPKQHKVKLTKTLRLLEQQGPRYPGLNSHPYESIRGPDGQPLWESYVENRTPSAWRLWWCYGPGEDQITIVTVGPHP